MIHLLDHIWQLLTILIGNNDACHGTDMVQFEADYRSVMDQLTAQLPDTKILMVSTPDIARLRNIIGRSGFCQFVWENYNVCLELLQEGSDVEKFKQYVIDMNNIIEDIADDYGDNVKFVNVYYYPFASEDISNLDCFHPSLRGQRILASLTWEGGFFA